MRLLLPYISVIAIILPGYGQAWEATDTSKLTDTLLSLRSTAANFNQRHYVSGSILEPSLVVEPYPDDNAIEIGEGFDLITGRRVMRKCVLFPGETRIDFNNKETSFSEVTDEESLWTKLNTSISAKASYAAYSGGGSYKSSIETKTSSKTITTVAQASLKTYVDTMDTPDAMSHNIIDLSDPAYQIILNEPAKFRESCGDGFVVQISYGASLYGILQFTDSAHSEKKKIEAAVNASGPGGVFSVDGKSSMESILEDKNTKINVQLIESGAKSGKLASSHKDLVDSFNSLGERAKGNERPIYVTVLRYSTLPRGKNRWYNEVSSGLEAMIKRSLRLKTIVNEINDAYRQYQSGGGDYVFISDIDDAGRRPADLLATKDKLIQLIQQTNDQIEKCIDSSTSDACLVPIVTDTDDLYWRAISPFPTNDIDSGLLQEIVKYAGIPVDAVKQVAECRFAKEIYANLVLKTDQVRCFNDNECSPSSELEQLRDIVYHSVGTTVQSCSGAGLI